MVNVGGKPHQGFGGPESGAVPYPDVTTLDELLAIDMTKQQQKDQFKREEENLEHLGPLLCRSVVTDSRLCVPRLRPQK